MVVGSPPFIRYNVLNLPDTIQFGNGRQIINSYDAGGHKLTTQYYTPIGTVVVTQGNIHGGYTTANSVLRLDDYCGSYLYENGTSASVHPLTKILTPEGYIDMSTSGYPYCYYKQDHLGSNREVTSYTGTTGTVVQQTEYYPSGTAYVEGTGAGVQPFKFTGKELITMHGLNWQDFGARWLDNVRMQWTTMDPLCEKYYAISPYTYCSDDPAKNIDPDGREEKADSYIAQQVILNTIPKVDRQYISFNKDGFINKDNLRNVESNSDNFNRLKTIVLSDKTVEIKIDNKFTYSDNVGNIHVATMKYLGVDPSYVGNENGKGIGVSTGETGFLGKVLFPDKNGIQNSPNKNIIVTINSGLSKEGMAQTYSHETNGHAYVYIITNGDRAKASHNYGQGEKDLNRYLFNLINKSINETINNMKQ
jgi:RHS repeat-associated protein